MSYKSLNIKICVACHKPVPIKKTDCIMPVHVGKALSTVDIQNAVGDDTGDNISKENPHWCELTGMYWMRKNLDADYYGLFHYRRLFNFNPKYTKTKLFSQISNDEFDKYHLNDKQIKKFCSNYDIILAPEFLIHPVNTPSVKQTAYDFYSWQIEEPHMIKMLEIIKQLTPEYLPYAHDFLNSKYMNYYNMFIMKRELFFEYSDWMFKILREVERVCPIPSDKYFARIFGFISERLLNIFVYKKRAESNIKVICAPSLLYGVFDKVDEADLPDDIFINKQTQKDNIDQTCNNKSHCNKLYIAFIQK